jgi:hypothetical protein
MEALGKILLALVGFALLAVFIHFGILVGLIVLSVMGLTVRAITGDWTE